MRRIKNAWRLTRVSWRVLRSDRELLVFPALGIIASGALFALFAAVFWPTLSSDNPTTVLTAAALTVAGLAAAAANLFFEGALVAGAYQRMSGGDPTISSSLSDARRCFRDIAAWAVINATVGILTRFLKDKAPCPAGIAPALTGFAWETATFLTLPAIVVDGDTAMAAIKRSASSVRRTWGENITAQIGMRIAAATVILPVILITGWVGSRLGEAGEMLAVVMAAASALTVSVVMTALSACYKTCLYLYAEDGLVPEGVDESDIRSARAR